MCKLSHGKNYKQMHKENNNKMSQGFPLRTLTALSVLWMDFWVSVQVEPPSVEGGGGLSETLQQRWWLHCHICCHCFPG